MFIAQADIPPVIPIVAPESSVPGRNIQEDTNEKDSIFNRDDAKEFPFEFLERLNDGINTILPYGFELNGRPLDEEEVSVARAVIVGFVLNNMYADVEKARTIENLDADLGLFGPSDNGDPNPFLNLLASGGISSYHSHQEAFDNLERVFGPVCLVELTDAIYQLPPFRSLLLKYALGENVSAADKQIFLDWVIEQHVNYAESPNNLIARGNLKYGYVWSDPAIKAAWERKHVKPISDLIKINCPPYASKEDLRRKQNRVVDKFRPAPRDERSYKRDSGRQIY